MSDLLAQIYLLGRKAIRRILMVVLRSHFKSHGKNFKFDPFGSYSFKTISVGSDVFIGSGACLHASQSEIIIGNKVMFGPNVTIMGGDHNSSEIGVYMFDQKRKRPEDDQPVVIEDDVWIGTGVIVLKGVTVGTGSIIAAGALVNQDVPPYSVVGGIPAKKIRARFSEEDLKRHLELLD